MGRVNPPGISYLYTALDEQTAIAEMRMGRECVLSLAPVSLICDVRLVDLSNVKPLRSPLGRETLKADLDDRWLLMRFAEELSKPVRPEDGPLEYVPTQYLAETVLDLGYDGLLYKSGFAKGENLVLFDKAIAQVDDVRLVVVEDINVEWNDYLP